MPNRMLRDWTRSEIVDKLSCEAERFFTRLIMRVDDFGCFFADTRILKGELFILKLNQVREADISRWMAECQKAGLIVLYESEGKKYLQIQDFRQRLDKAKSKFPKPVNILPAVVNDSPAELEVEKKRKEGAHPQKDEEILYTIEHCVVVALNDERWVRSNKTNEKELKEFNELLEGRGIYSKNPADYKEHFHNWKKGGKKEERFNEPQPRTTYKNLMEND